MTKVFQKEQATESLTSALKREAKEATKLYFSPITAVVNVVSRNIKRPDGKVSICNTKK